MPPLNDWQSPVSYRLNTTQSNNRITAPEEPPPQSVIEVEPGVFTPAPLAASDDVQVVLGQGEKQQLINHYRRIQFDAIMELRRRFNPDAPVQQAHGVVDRRGAEQQSASSQHLDPCDPSVHSQHNWALPQGSRDALGPMFQQPPQSDPTRTPQRDGPNRALSNRAMMMMSPRGREGVSGAPHFTPLASSSSMAAGQVGPSTASMDPPMMEPSVHHSRQASALGPESIPGYLRPLGIDEDDDDDPRHPYRDPSRQIDHERMRTWAMGETHRSVSVAGDAGGSGGRFELTPSYQPPYAEELQEMKELHRRPFPPHGQDPMGPMGGYRTRPLDAEADCYGPMMGSLNPRRRRPLDGDDGYPIAAAGAGPTGTRAFRHTPGFVAPPEHLQRPLDRPLMPHRGMDNPLERGDLVRDCPSEASEARRPVAPRDREALPGYLRPLDDYLSEGNPLPPAGRSGPPGRVEASPTSAREAMRRAIEYFDDDCQPNEEEDVPEEGTEEWEDLCDRQQLLEWCLQKEEKLERCKKEARKLQWILDQPIVDYQGPRPVEPSTYRMVELCHLSQHVTEEMLVDYFSQLARIELCSIDERIEPKVQGMVRYATVCFYSMNEVDLVMAHRPHILGGFRLQVRRHLRVTQPEERQKCTEVMVKNLLLSHTQEAVEEYFAFFGQINECTLDYHEFSNDEFSEYGSALIEFADYDAVDKLFLYDEHRILQRPVVVERVLKERIDPLAEMDTTEQLIEFHRRKRDKQRRHTKLARAKLGEHGLADDPDGIEVPIGHRKYLGGPRVGAVPMRPRPPMPDFISFFPPVPPPAPLPKPRKRAVPVIKLPLASMPATMPGYPPVVFQPPPPPPPVPPPPPPKGIDTESGESGGRKRKSGDEASASQQYQWELDSFEGLFKSWVRGSDDSTTSTLPKTTDNTGGISEVTSSTDPSSSSATVAKPAPLRIDLQSLAAKNKRGRREQEPAYIMRANSSDGPAGSPNTSATSGGGSVSYDTVLKDVEQILFGTKGAEGRK